MAGQSDDPSEDTKESTPERWHQPLPTNINIEIGDNNIDATFVIQAPIPEYTVAPPPSADTNNRPTASETASPAHCNSINVRIGNDNKNLDCRVVQGPASAKVPVDSSQSSISSVPDRPDRPGTKLITDLKAEEEPKRPNRSPRQIQIDAKAERVMKLMKMIHNSSQAIPEMSGWVQELYQREQMLQARTQMEYAIATEDYKSASKYRDVMRELQKNTGDRRYLEERLDQVVEQNDFTEAKVIRDKLLSLETERWARPISADSIRPGTVIMRVNPQQKAVSTALSRPLKRWAVILILKHDRSGTMGLVLNNLLGELVGNRAKGFGEELDAIHDVCDEPLFFDGGEPLTTSITVLHQQRTVKRKHDLDLSTNLFDLFANVRHLRETNPTFIDTLDELEDGQQVRFFNGHMAWLAGLLQEEAEQDLWFPAEISPSLIFSHTQGEDLWNEVWDLLEEWCVQHLSPEAVKNVEETAAPAED
eukprot:CAMPEP_0174286118 /NCGR_PEP_ID=MMETSP0809-20121228/10631_1 /TAXON_ID=73025 ORGANISM="Eutreptiella gymnastica-like, Strain CCMP1594" /NCGR_SAMPLE_ID=MMETSP0809 /ASSEMBLY_ACC=CAM_ASM_000658 /LENGTH=476 /DNA_ID=CAMNT_0015382057 /DNA_START=580 /DNA_END=2010 /DNA_ORIENTATION=+